MSTAALSYGRVAAHELTVVTGIDDVLSLETDVERLAARCSAPVTARWPWLAPLLTAPGVVPWAVLAVRGDELSAAAIGTRGRDGWIRLAGGNDRHRADILAVDPAAGSFLGEVLATGMLDADVAGFEFGLLDPDAPAVVALQAALGPAAVALPTEIPQLRRDGSATGSSYLSRNMRRTLRRARRQVSTSGVRCEVRRHRDVDEVLERLPAVVALARRRDHACDRPSPYDDAAVHSAWWARVCGLARLGRVELSTLSIDGDLAAYDLAFVDGDCYRVMEGRFEPGFEPFAPGRLLEAALVEQVLVDEGAACIDWMTDLATEQLLAVNAAEPRVTLRSC